MFINWFEFENYTTGQKIERINFDRLNLLVGESGAGKTQILKILSAYIEAIIIKKNIPFAGHFQIEFTINTYKNTNNFKEKEIVNWEIETIDVYEKSTIVNLFQSRYIIRKEILTKNNSVIINRDYNNLTFKNKQIPVIPHELSAFFVYSNTDELINIQPNIMRFISYNHQMNSFRPMPKKQLDTIRDIYTKQIQNEKKLDSFDFSTNMPLAIIDFNINKKKDMYSLFITQLQEIFPSIEDLKIDCLEEELYRLYIKQQNKWIPDYDISSGMMKTMYIISMVEYCKDAAVILLDELENALGINCLNEVTDYICDHAAENEIQFILTSHHPYIINNIPQNNWHIISQDNGIISSKRAVDIGIDNSFTKNEKFIKLINYMKRNQL